jgi:hypothetical protein
MNRNQIKMLAIAAMTIDHTALVFVASDSLLYYVMRLFGRVTAPIMAFMLAEGYRYTRSRSRYLLRLVAFALLSQPFYYRLAFDRTPNGWLDFCMHWNVMFSLAVALLSLMILESDLPTVPRLILTGCCVSLAQFGDWSFMIPGWAIIFHVFGDDERKRMLLFALVSVVLQTLIWLPQSDDFASFSFQFGTLQALIPISMYNGQCGNVRHKNLNRWFYYVFYPTHMIVLLVIQVCMKCLLHP